MLRNWVVLVLAILLAGFIIGYILKHTCDNASENFDNRVQLRPGRPFWNYWLSSQDMYKLQKFECNPFNGSYTQCTNQLPQKLLNTDTKKIPQWLYGYNIHH